MRPPVTCECLTIMINTVYAEHGNLPTLSVQFDGASNNRCIAVLAYLGLYVLEGVFSSIRVRCLLENHAHDVYDAFQAVHAGRVRHSTFFVPRRVAVHNSGRSRTRSRRECFESDCGARRVGSRRDCWGHPSRSLFAFVAGLWGLLAPCNALLGCPQTHPLQGK